MAKVYNQVYSLSEYRQLLIRERQNMEADLRELKKLFCSLEWNDSVRELTKVVLNDHINQMNAIFTRLERMAGAAGLLEIQADEYSNL